MVNPTTKYFDALDVLECVSNEMSHAITNLFAIHEAMTGGNFSAATFTDALLFTQKALEGQQQKLSGCVELLFTQYKNHLKEAAHD